MPIELFLATVPPRHRAAALYEQLRDAIDTGRLGIGDRLPTSRDLSGDVGVSRSTVTTVYGRLVAEGYVEGRTGDGTFVSGARAPTAVVAAAEVVEPATASWRADLRTGRPEATLDPLEQELVVERG